MIFRTAQVNEMLERLNRVFGSGAATIVDQMAEAMGRHFANEVSDEFGREFALAHLDELLHNYSALGYASVSVERSKTSDLPAVVHAAGLFECEANAKRRMRRKSVFFRAHLRGFMSSMLGAELEVDEVQCIAEGDETCSFHLGVPAAALSPIVSRSLRLSS